MVRSRPLTLAVIAALVTTSALTPTAALAVGSDSQAAKIEPVVLMKPVSPGPTIETSCGLLTLNGVATEVKPLPKLKLLNSSMVRVPKIDGNVLAISCSRDSIVPVPGDERVLKNHTKPLILSDGIRTGTLSFDKAKYKFAVSSGKLTREEDLAVKAGLKQMQAIYSANKPKNSSGNKALGCGLGMILGGLLGAVVANKKDRGAAIVVGAAAGCAAGWGFAANWSKNDKDGLDIASNNAFDAPGGSSRWQAPESGAQVNFTTAVAKDRNEDVEFQYVDGIEPPPDGSLVIARPYRTTSRLALRSSPDTDEIGNIIGRYNAGQTVEVVGLTPDAQWAMIGDEGIVVGYASRSGLTDAGQALRVARTDRYFVDSSAAGPAKAAPAKGKGRTKARAAAPVSAARVATPAAQASVKAVKIAATTQCKTLVAVTGQVTDTKTGCNRPGGKWNIA